MGPFTGTSYIRKTRVPNCHKIRPSTDVRLLKGGRGLVGECSIVGNEISTLSGCEILLCWTVTIMK